MLLALMTAASFLAFSCRQQAVPLSFDRIRPDLTDTAHEDEMEIYTPAYGLESRIHFREFKDRPPGNRYLLQKGRGKSFCYPVLINYGKDVRLP